MKDNEQAAYRRGLDEGTATARRDLRTFTGWRDIVPRLDLAEHEAYPQYLQELQAQRVRLEDAIEMSRAEIERLDDQHTAARDQLNGELRQRRASRDDANILARWAGELGDKRLPAQKEVTAIAGSKEFSLDLLAEQYQWASELDDEIFRVARWLDQLLEHVDNLKETRAAEEARQAEEAERAARDVSPRWCTVYTLDDFIAEDRRRQASGWDLDQGAVVGGLDFGYRWHRDQDLGPDALGEWSLHMIEETSETVLEHRPRNGLITVWLLGTAITSRDVALKVFLPIEDRQRERNSLALVLDRYDAYARDTITI